MHSFWHHAVRTPMLGIAAAMLATGWWGALDWSAALAAACVAALAAKAADRLGRRDSDEPAPAAMNISEFPRTPAYKQYENKYDRAA